ncbi:MAG: hypothetical protein ACRDH5_04435 [bacterium]
MVPAGQRRLGEAAHYLMKTERPEAAGRVLAVAAALGENPGGRGVPFCEELVRRSFGLFFAREAEREREGKASSVLVTPDPVPHHATPARWRWRGMRGGTAC